MAIDTAEKRRSAASVGGPFWIPGVTPTALPDAEWRQQAGWSYSGISAAIATPPATEATFTVPAITRTFTVPALTTTFTVPDPE